MNKIRVCAFLALVVFIGSVVTDMFSGFMDGWNEAGDQKDFHALQIGRASWRERV